MNVLKIVKRLEQLMKTSDTRVVRQIHSCIKHEFDRLKDDKRTYRITAALCRVDHTGLILEIWWRNAFSVYVLYGPP